MSDLWVSFIVLSSCVVAAPGDAKDIVIAQLLSPFITEMFSCLPSNTVGSATSSSSSIGGQAQDESFTQQEPQLRLPRITETTPLLGTELETESVGKRLDEDQDGASQNKQGDGSVKVENTATRSDRKWHGEQLVKQIVKELYSRRDWWQNLADDVCSSHKKHDQTNCWNGDQRGLWVIFFKF